MKSIFKRGGIRVAIITIAISIVAIVVWQSNSSEGKFSLESETVKRESVSNTVTATGTLEATNTVVVGTQVSGVIEKLYVDFNSPVKEGQLIAELDKLTLLSGLEIAEASVENAEADLEYQTSTLQRMKALLAKEMLAQSEYDQHLYNYKKSLSQLKSTKADLSRAKQNLSYAMIYSPIDGVVLNRAVEEGQTVAASMNTPELFTITNDLAEMEVEADIDEADIGMIAIDQRVDFTVDAFPDDIFKGSISEIRLQPNESSNVVTYTVVIAVENREYKLKPGMTASITSYVEEVVDVLTISSKALRFKADMETIHNYIETERKQNAEMSDQNRQRNHPNKEMNIGEDESILWVVKDTDIYPVAVKLGVSNGLMAEVISGLNEGERVITSLTQVSGIVREARAESSEAESPEAESGGSPFMPTRPKRGGRK